MLDFTIEKIFNSNFLLGLRISWPASFRLRNVLALKAVKSSSLP